MPDFSNFRDERFLSIALRGFHGSPEHKEAIRRQIYALKNDLVQPFDDDDETLFRLKYGK